MVEVIKQKLWCPFKCWTLELH